MAQDELQPDSSPPPSGLMARLETVRAVLRFAVGNNTGPRSWVAPIVLVGCLVFVIGWWIWGRPRGVDPEATLENALARLDEQRFVHARELADRMAASPNMHPEDLGGPAFIRGAATVYESDVVWESRDRTRQYLLASRYLEEARDRGLPPGREAEGLYLLGLSLHESRQFARAIPVLLESLQHPYEESEVHQLLASSYYNDAAPNYKQALTHVQAYLEDRVLEPEDRHAGLLLESQIRFELGDFTGSRETLDRIPTTSGFRADGLVMHGRLIMAQAEKLLHDPQLTAKGLNEVSAAKKYDSAISTLRQAQGFDTLGNQASRKAAFLIGLCYRQLKDFRAANEQFVRARKLYFNTPEGLASSLEEADVLRLLGHDDEAIEAYRRTLHAAGQPEEFSNPWVTLEELQQRMQAAYESYLDAHKYDLAIELTGMMVPLLSRQKAIELQAEGQKQWAEYLVASAEPLPPTKSEPLRAQARRQWRNAGSTYQLLSRLLFTDRTYSDMLWASGHAYLAGRDYRQAAAALREYLKNETRERRPQALVSLGEALIALDQIDDAITALSECISAYPRDQAVYTARLLASQAYAEKGDMARARELLQMNLQNEDLHPLSPEWRDSLFAQGRLWHLEGLSLEAQSRMEGVNSDDPDVMKLGLKMLEASHKAHQEAIKNLSEAVARYPDVPQAIESRYMIGQSHVQAAKLPQRRMRFVSIETTRVQLNRELQSELAEGMDAYAEVIELLNRRQEETELTYNEELILRNCYFAQGAALFDRGRYEEAIRAYSNATNRYQHEPEALEAYVQIAACYRHLNKPVEARGTLEQAKVVLSRIREDAPFTQTTRYSRSDWGGFLDWLTRL